jgi:hypothetical protein
VSKEEGEGPQWLQDLTQEHMALPENQSMAHTISHTCAICMLLASRQRALDRTAAVAEVTSSEREECEELLDEMLVLFNEPRYEAEDLPEQLRRVKDAVQSLVYKVDKIRKAVD